ncbi:dipeptide ABC transporter ATP-binding protein [soil metagenome]
MSEVVLSARGVTKLYPVYGGVFSRQRGDVKAVQDVSLDLNRGETVGLVGESGCGKSTLGRMLLRLENATAGTVTVEGKDILHAPKSELFPMRRHMQMIFQDPYSSLNPRMTIGEIVQEPLAIHRVGDRRERTAMALGLIQKVGLKEEMLDRYPHEFSGGQRQRVGIARALALSPRIIVADEPVSALDVSVQAQVINLMVSLQKELQLTYLFISHDLSVVEYISDRIMIMYLGRIVEEGPKRTIFDSPKHPYTRALIASAPVRDPRKREVRVALKGEIPSAMNPPAGCAFHPRCPYMIPACKEIIPPLEAVNDGDPTHRAACIRKHEI